ncbi:MAG: ABC transporter substrate-binding protein [Xanthobacteraceae bacterium]|nr:ABC transporter substrate-binding protein [Xanthobacteraceae bacterium]
MTIHIRRREFLITLGNMTVAWPLAVCADQPKVPTIGALVIGNISPEEFWRVFRQGLRDLGYIEGQNIRFEFRSAQGQIDRLPELAAELVRLKVDVIVTWFTPTALAAKQATREIPIVMAETGDPIGTGLVMSLSRPGGNVTGIASITAELAGKSVQLIRDMLPSARRVTALANATDPFSKPFLEQIQRGGEATGTAIKPVRVSNNEEFESAFAAMERERPDAIIVQPSLPSKRAAELALQHRVPAVSVPRWFADEGGLMSYSAIYADLFHKAAVYVDKILKGAQPADLPVEQPTRFQLVINMKTARALGITVPATLLARADEVID